MINETLDLIHMTQCLTGGNPDDFDIWIERYAEMLNCEPRAGAVAVAIESMTGGKPANYERLIWLEGMANILLCEPRPVSIIEAVQKQHEELKSAKRMIANLRNKRATSVEP